MKKIQKKLWAFVLCLAIVATVFPAGEFVAFAGEDSSIKVEESTDGAWDGTTRDTTWYTEAPDGTTCFTIDTAAELAGFASLVRSGQTFRNKTVELGADIDLNGWHWTPIGYDKIPSFQGEFDGNGYTISNLYIDGSKLGSQKAGLFGQIGCGGDDNARHGAYLHDFTIYNTLFENLTMSAAVVAGSAFHDNVLEDITVDTATLSGNSPSSAIVNGVQSSQFKNILAKNVTINANNGGEIGGLFCSIQGALGDSKVKHYANNYCLPGTIISDSDNSNLKDNPVLITYFENCKGENITINVKKANSYIGGFASYCLDYPKDSAFFIDCDITDLEINILSTSGSPSVGGFIGLRAGVVNKTYTNSDGVVVTLNACDGCSVSGEINGSVGTYGGFVAESGVYVNYSKSAVTYSNVTSDMDIAVSADATVGGFAGSVNTKKGSVAQSFSDCIVDGTTKLGDNDATGSGFIGKAVTSDTVGLVITDCSISGEKDLDERWEMAKKEDSTLDELTWMNQEMCKLLVGNALPDSGLTFSITSTITFDTQGGTEIPPITQEMGTTVTAPSHPTRTHYEFLGWDRKIPTTMPAGNMTITALWKANDYSITFDTDGGSTIDPITQPHGTAIIPPADPTREGYTFMGWDVEIPETMPIDGLTVTALWKINEYTITFDTDGGSAIDAITQDYGTAITLPDNPTKEGYTFMGWDVEIPATMPGENLTVKAVWIVNSYTITFNTNGGSTVDAITQDYGTEITPPADPTREGYVFAGWSQEIPDTMPDEDLVIEAEWTPKEPPDYDTFSPTKKLDFVIFSFVAVLLAFINMFF